MSFCGYELQLDQVNKVIDDRKMADHGIQPAAGVEVGDQSGQDRKRKRGFSIDRTGGGTDGQHAYADPTQDQQLLQQHTEHQYQQKNRAQYLYFWPWYSNFEFERKIFFYWKHFLCKKIAIIQSIFKI